MSKSKSWRSIGIFFLVILLALLASAALVFFGVKYFGSDFRSVLESSFKYFFVWRILLYALMAWFWLKAIKPSLLRKAEDKRQAVLERLKIRERWFMTFIVVYEIAALYSAFSTSVGG